MTCIAKILLMALTLFASFEPTWAVQKCTGRNGKVTFQDAPCASGSGEKLRIRPASGQEGDSAMSAQAQARIEKLKRDNEMSEAIRTHKPMVGMSKAQLQEAMGPATHVNVINYKNVQSAQLIYERPTESWYVHMTDGFVDSVQHRLGAPLANAPAAANTRCPTEFEIKNAIT